MFSKVLVANRGEIAIRAFRAAYELGIATVAVFPWEDRNSVHRLKADESYQIGEEGHPVRAYLSVSEIIAAAQRAGADAIYPGYGFLSENPDLAAACAEAGITFVGPSAQVLELTGNKARAIAAARETGLPVLASTAPSETVAELLDAAQDMEFPVFVKAVAGGGGRGMRRVSDLAQLEDNIEAAMREAESAFGDATVFLEQAVVDPRHIEVQILADGRGGVVHLFERDCSVQRRHQKVIELAPAPNLDPELRERICVDAVAFARAIDYSCAGTVEFLVDPDGRHVFIEMNPRIQVEHTVTEEVTDVDLVQSQLRIAAGESLADLGLSQDTIVARGAALQLRITTEDPANGFRLDTGRITRLPLPGGCWGPPGRWDHAGRGGGRALRLDDGEAHLPGQGLPDRRRPGPARRHRVPHPRGVHQYPVSAGGAGGPRLSGRQRHHQLHRAAPTAAHHARFRRSGNPAADLPRRRHRQQAERRATQHSGPAAEAARRRPVGATTGWLPPTLAGPRAAGLGSRAAGTHRAGGHRHHLPRRPPVPARDRVRTRDLLAVAGHVARATPQLLSLEAWGGATYDVALRFLAEDPWERLAELREAVPNICLQMLLRGRNTVGYTPYPEEVTEAFVREAASTGVDIFRIFDALNDVAQMRPAIDAVRESGTAVAEVALRYTADLSNPAETLYTLDYYLRLAEQIVDAGAHVLAIKDMAGLLRAPAAATLVSALRSRFDLPVHLHTHDTPGGQLATLLSAWQAGVDAVDGATASMAGTTSQPALSAIVAATDHTERSTGLDLQAVCDMEPYWEAVRKVYAPFESGLPAPTGRVYHHEIPGGQLSNLRQQAIALGLGDRFEEIEDRYAAADEMLGRFVKVTPSSKVVGDLALHLVGAGVSPADFEADPASFDLPDSVIGFLRGELGDPPGGWPEPFRTRALQGRPAPKPVAELSPQDRSGLAENPRQTLNRLLFPGPTKEFESHRDAYGATSVLPSKDFFYGLRPGAEHAVDLEPGVRLLIGLEAISEADERGLRTVMFTLNGQLRPVSVRDRAVASDVKVAEKADPGNPAQVAAPFAGVVSLAVAEGEEVSPGATVATIEAMKMEAAITAPRAGKVARVAISSAQQVEGGDLLVVLD